MKTIIEIVIETPEVGQCNVIPEELIAIPEEDWNKDQKAMAQKAREVYPKDLHAYVVKSLRGYINDGFEDHAIDNMEEVSIEDYDSFDKYGINVTVCGGE